MFIDSFSERAAELSALNTEGHSTINCSTEFEPDACNSSGTKRVKKLNILQTKNICMSSLVLLHAFAAEMSQ